MVTAIRVSHTGAPDVMSVEQVEAQAPSEGLVWVEQEAIGVNILDVTQRNGTVPMRIPSGLGYEGAGRVTAVGPGVASVRVGDRVGYATGPIGAYASGRLYPADRLVLLPDELSATDAAAILFKGVTAQYLIKSTHPVGPGSIIVLYGVTGGLGQIMTPWAKRLGAVVIGVVAKESDIDSAKTLGCDAAFVSTSDLPAKVAEFTAGKKADVVYDPIGRATFEMSLDCLHSRGTMVSFGASSGAVPPVSVDTLNTKGSLYLTRPSIFAYTVDASECRRRAEDVLSACTAGIIKPSVWKTFPLADVAAAHTAMESGKSSGAIVLTT